MASDDSGSGRKLDAPERWMDIQRLFEQAADLPPGERAGLLNGISATDLSADLERLLAGDERADEVLGPFEDRDAFSTWASDVAFQRLEAALAGRYEVLESVGHGGMGTVYLARDLKHDRQIAIKTIHPYLATTDVRDRFEQEIQVTAHLQHPHILPLHDSGVAGDTLYYVMPYVEGESLRERMKRAGTLPKEEVVRIGRHISAALDYAHQHGVVHRDIKPENILLVGDQALVADFGTSKAVRAAEDPTLTGSGAVVGTPAYMPPEQYGGEVTGRSDVYALGAVLYEALSGRRWLLGTAVDEADWGGMDRDMRSVLTPALQPSPGDRWEDAGAFREALGEASRGNILQEIHRRSLWQVLVGFAIGSWAVLQVADVLAARLGLPLWFGEATNLVLAACFPLLLLTAAAQPRVRRLAGRGAPRTGVGRVLSWRNAALGGAGAFALLGVGTAGYMTMRSLGIGPAATLIAQNRLQEHARLVLADFASAPEDSALARTVTEALRIDLSQSRAVTLAEPRQVQQILGHMGRLRDPSLDLETAREVAIRGSMAAVIGGEFGRVGEQIVLTARILSAETGETLVSRRETAAGEQEILSAIDRLSAQLRERIGESLKQIRATPPLEAVTTRSLEALRKYAGALDAVGVWDPQYAIGLLEEAVALDPEFAMAWRKLGVVMRGQSRMRSLEALTKAFEFRHRLTDRERYLVVGTYYYNMGDRPKAIQAYRTLLENYPDDPLGNHNLAGGYASLRDYAAAETLYARVTRLDPARVFIESNVAVMSWWYLAQNQYAQGKTEEARATLERCAELYPDHPFLRVWVVGTAGTVTNYDTAEARTRAWADDVGASSQTHVWARWSLGGLLMLRGRLAETERLWRDVLSYEAEQGLKSDVFFDLFSLALMEAWHRRNPDGALRMIEEALAGYPLDSLPVLDRPYAELATLYAAAERPQLARAMLTAYEATIPLDPLREFDAGRLRAPTSEVSGDVALAEGRYDLAIAEYRAADRAMGCQICGLAKLANAYDAAGQPDSALAVYERYVTLPWMHRFARDIWWLPFTLERLGQLYRARGDAEKAAHYYGRFVELWRDADPELQPRVQAARQRLDEMLAG